MASTSKASTPQFQTALIRKLKNIAPEFDVEIVDTTHGVIECTSAKIYVKGRDGLPNLGDPGFLLNERKALVG